jgi:transposase
MSGVERLFAWLTGFRRLALRWERLASTFLGLIQLACIMIHWRVLR